MLVVWGNPADILAKTGARLNFRLHQPLFFVYNDPIHTLLYNNINAVHRWPDRCIGKKVGNVVSTVPARHLNISNA